MVWTNVSNEPDLHTDPEEENAVNLQNYETNVNSLSRARFFCQHCEYTCYQQKILKSHIDFVHYKTVAKSSVQEHQDTSENCT